MENNTRKLIFFVQGKTDMFQFTTDESTYINDIKKFVSSHLEVDIKKLIMYFNNAAVETNIKLNELTVNNQILFKIQVKRK